jgi:hypothetical protein
MIDMVGTEQIARQSPMSLSSIILGYAALFAQLLPRVKGIFHVWTARLDSAPAQLVTCSTKLG